MDESYFYPVNNLLQNTYESKETVIYNYFHTFLQFVVMDKGTQTVYSEDRMSFKSPRHYLVTARFAFDSKCFVDVCQ